MIWPVLQRSERMVLVWGDKFFSALATTVLCTATGNTWEFRTQIRESYVDSETLPYLTCCWFCSLNKSHILNFSKFECVYLKVVAWYRIKISTVLLPTPLNNSLPFLKWPSWSQGLWLSPSAYCTGIRQNPFWGNLTRSSSGFHDDSLNVEMVWTVDIIAAKHLFPCSRVKTAPGFIKELMAI